MAMVTVGSPVVQNGVSAAMFYLVAYTLTSFAAWAVVIAVEHSMEKEYQLADYAGLGRRSPLLAGALTVALLSFTGIPPTLGFWGKFYLFQTVLSADGLGLVILAVLTSFLSAYYYLRVIVVMYMQEGQAEARGGVWTRLVAVGAALAILAFSIVAAPVFHWAAQAVLQ
jgi:NADH-quinone oxidoreductase subunit N